MIRSANQKFDTDNVNKEIALQVQDVNAKEAVNK